MQKKDMGYGICGAKRIYTSKVRQDNWAEDEFGKMLADTSRPGQRSFISEQMEKHCHPSLWPEPKAPSGKILTPQEMVQKNKEGMPYSLIFNHGIREMPADERFKSMAKLSITKLENIESFNKPERSLERAKDKKDKEDIDLAFRKQTQARLAAAYQTSGLNDSSEGRKQPSADLPRFTRY